MTSWSSLLQLWKYLEIVQNKINLDFFFKCYYYSFAHFLYNAPWKWNRI